MITKGTLEEALWASAGMNGTQDFLKKKGVRVRKDDVLVELTPRQDLITKNLQDTEDIDEIMETVMAKRKQHGKEKKETMHSHSLDRAFDVVFAASRKNLAGEKKPLPKEDDEWRDDLRQHLKDYKVHMRRDSKLDCSKEQLIANIDELTRNRYTEVETLLKKRQSEMERSGMFSKVTNEQRLTATRNAEMWKRVNMQTVKKDLIVKMTKPLKKSDLQNTNESEQLFIEAFGEAKVSLSPQSSSLFPSKSPPLSSLICLPLACCLHPGKSLLFFYACPHPFIHSSLLLPLQSQYLALPSPLFPRKKADRPRLLLSTHFLKDSSPSIRQET